MATVVGLTGGIGSGKSTVAQIMEELGAAVVDADKMAHEIYAPGTQGWKEIVATFGEEVLTPRGEVDRAKLAKLVFGNREALERLNEITHPKVRDAADARIAQYIEQGFEIVVLEEVLLLETKWPSKVDEIWVVVVSEDTALKRLSSRPNLSREQALSRLRAQMSNEERIKRADTVIYNDGDFEQLRAAVVKEWERLHKKE